MLPNQQQGVKDVSSFVLDEIAKYGGPNIPKTNNAGNDITDYIYSEDEDGFQVISFGNKVAVFQGILQPHFGTPVMAKTNANGLSSFVYGSPQGVAINCSLGSGTVKGSQREWTQLVVVKPGALK
jgi:hypothetical protein